MGKSGAKKKGKSNGIAQSGFLAAKKAMDAIRKKNEPAVITFHSLGDMDACASALALAEYIGGKAVVAPPDKVNSESRRILQERAGKFVAFSRAVEKYPDAKIILLDANDASLLAHLDGMRIDLLIDHHAMQKNSVRADVEWVDAEASACCQMMAKIIDKPTPEQSELLIFGILSDSARLRRAGPETFEVLAKLLKNSSMDYESFLSILEKPDGAQSRAAVLEGMRNATWNEEGDEICAVAAVSSHEAHVAEALVAAGADCAFAGIAGKEGCRISARMRPSLSSKVDLPKIMEEIGKELEGHGGGHPAAAGATGRRAEMLEDALALAAREFFRQARQL